MNRRVISAVCIIAIAAVMSTVFVRSCKQNRSLASPKQGRVTSVDADIQRARSLLHDRVAALWRNGSALPNSRDLTQISGNVIDVWGDDLTVDAYVDELIARGMRVNEQAVELAIQRRSQYLDQFPADAEWNAASPEDKVRAYLRFAWADHSPVASFVADSVETWQGQERGAPLGYSGAQGMLARFLPPDLTLADVQNADQVAWLRVRARMHGHSSEHAIDFRFIYEPKTQRWYPAEVRVYGEKTNFRWGV